MKTKIFKLTILSLISLVLSSCDIVANSFSSSGNTLANTLLSSNSSVYQEGTYQIFKVQENDKPVKTNELVNYISVEFKEKYDKFNPANRKEIFESAYNITPDELDDKFQLYRYPATGPGWIQCGIIFIYIDGDFYHFGGGSGGFGTTEFVYYKDDAEEKMFYITSGGSGIHRSLIKYFDFSTKKSYSIDTEFDMKRDFTFKTSLDGHYLELWTAKITSSGEKYGYSYSITELSPVCYDVTDLSISEDFISLISFL